MIVVVCLDDLGGMLFNNRRQSRDRMLIGDMLTLAGDSPVWMAPYSLNLFSDFSGADIMVSDDFLTRAGEGEYAFVEERDVSPYLQKIEKIVVYRWNRRYPRDFTFSIDLKDWELREKCNIPGYSHETITREIYER